MIKIRNIKTVWWNHFTKPEFRWRWSEPDFVICPVSVEIFRPILSSLNYLKWLMTNKYFYDTSKPSVRPTYVNKLKRNAFYLNIIWHGAQLMLCEQFNWCDPGKWLYSVKFIISTSFGSIKSNIQHD